MKSNDLRLLLSKGSSRTLFITVIFASILWAAIVVANGVLLASIIVGLIEKHKNVEHQIILLGLLWILRAIFQTRFELWCSVQASKIKMELRSEVTSQIKRFENQSPAHLSAILVKGLNSHLVAEVRLRRVPTETQAITYSHRLDDS